MSDTPHVFLCCDRGDHIAWLEASWLADQDVEIWCEDGVNPGNPDWTACEAAMSEARERLFLVTNQFIHSIDSLAKLTHSLKHDLPCTAVVLEPLFEGTESEKLLQQCAIVRKYELSLSAYRAELAKYLGVTPEGAPQVAGSLSPIQESGYRLGEWRVYPQMLRIECETESKTLDRRLFDVLGALVEAAPDPVTIDQFLDRVWGQTVVEDNSVHRAISRLRKALARQPTIAYLYRNDLEDGLPADQPHRHIRGPGNTPERKHPQRGGTAEGIRRHRWRRQRGARPLVNLAGPGHACHDRGVSRHASGGSDTRRGS